MNNRYPGHTCGQPSSQIGYSFDFKSISKVQIRKIGTKVSIGKRVSGSSWNVLRSWATFSGNVDTEGKFTSSIIQQKIRRITSHKILVTKLQKSRYTYVQEDVDSSSMDFTNNTFQGEKKLKLASFRTRNTQP